MIKPSDRSEKNKITACLVADLQTHPLRLLKCAAGSIAEAEAKRGSGQSSGCGAKPWWAIARRSAARLDGLHHRGVQLGQALQPGLAVQCLRRDWQAQSSLPLDHIRWTGHRIRPFSIEVQNVSPTVITPCGRGGQLTAKARLQLHQCMGDWSIALIAHVTPDTCCTCPTWCTSGCTQEDPGNRWHPRGGTCRALQVSKRIGRALTVWHVERKTSRKKAVLRIFDRDETRSRGKAHKAVEAGGAMPGRLNPRASTSDQQSRYAFPRKPALEPWRKTLFIHPMGDRLDGDLTDCW